MTKSLFARRTKTIKMTQGSAKIQSTPSKSDSTKELGAELQAVVQKSTEGQFDYNYIYGLRKLGDPLIDFHEESKQWNYPQDVELVVACHAEKGQCVAYADVKVGQSSTEHDAQIIAGGIGQNHIRILVRARNTYWYKYEVRMYGRAIVPEINDKNQ